MGSAVDKVKEVSKVGNFDQFGKIGKEINRAKARIKDDPASLFTFGATDGQGNTFGAKGDFKRVAKLAGKGIKLIAEESGLKQTEAQINAENAAIAADNARATRLSQDQRTQDIGNRAASQGASVRLGRSSKKSSKPSSSLGLGSNTSGQTGVQQ